MRGGGEVVHRGGGWSGSLEGRGVVNGRRRGVVNGSRGGGVIYERRRGVVHVKWREEEAD